MPNRRQISEADWRHWRRVREQALERFCAKVLRDAARLETGSGTAHERYLALYKLIQRRDHQLGEIFDGPRRSAAYAQIAQAARARLLTSEEMDEFSEDTRQVIEFLAQNT
jgi:hypothetical protein